MEQLASGDDTLVLTDQFDGFDRDALFQYWTRPELLSQWWPPKAEIDPRVGGRYHFSWPDMNWHLRGQYTSFDPGQRLAFTWAWDHEPNLPLEEVILVFAEDEEGTRLTLTHGPFPEDEQGQKTRADHLEGWQHFLGKLRDLTE